MRAITRLAHYWKVPWDVACARAGVVTAIRKEESLRELIVASTISRVENHYLNWRNLT